MKRIFAAMMPLIIACSLSTTAAAQNLDTLFITAVQVFSEGHYNKARPLFAHITEKDPGNDAAWYYLGRSEAARGNYESAQHALEHAVKLDSSNYWYRQRLARMAIAQKNIDRAIELYEGLNRDFPDNNDAVYELLDLYLRAQKFEKALTMLDEIDRQRGPSEEVARTRYDVYAAMGRQDEGAQELEKFNQQYAVPSILSTLGDYYLADYADSLAEVRYREALSLDSGYVPAQLGLSEVYRHKRDYGGYFETLEPFFTSTEVPAATKGMYISNMVRSLDPKMIQLHQKGFDHMVQQAAAVHPTDTTVLSAVAGYYYGTGRADEAGPYFRDAAAAHPESETLVGTYVHYLSLQQDWKACRERALEAYRNSGNLMYVDYMNMADFQLKDFDAVLETCASLLKQYPSDKKICLQAWSLSGDAWHQKGNPKASYKAYDNALKLDPAYVPVLNNYAYYLSLEGKKLKKAYSMSKKTVEAEPDNATYLDTFGWILHLMGKDLEAKPFFKHAMLYGGKENTVILEHYSVVLDALGESDSAQVYRRMAERLGPQEE